MHVGVTRRQRNHSLVAGVVEGDIRELTIWFEQRGTADVADSVRGALDAIDKNEELIKLMLAVLCLPYLQKKRPHSKRQPQFWSMRLLSDNAVINFL
ncbi:hypothetical protein [Pseudomonas sp. SDO5591_S426]